MDAFLEPAILLSLVYVFLKCAGRGKQGQHCLPEVREVREGSGAF